MLNESVRIPLFSLSAARVCVAAAGFAGSSDKAQPGPQGGCTAHGRETVPNLATVAGNIAL